MLCAYKSLGVYVIGPVRRTQHLGVLCARQPLGHAQLWAELCVLIFGRWVRGAQCQLPLCRWGVLAAVAAEVGRATFVESGSVLCLLGRTQHRACYVRLIRWSACRLAIGCSAAPAAARARSIR